MMNIIKLWAEIERTGELPPGFRWDMITWDSKNGWKGYVAGPGGATNWIKCKKIPKKILDELQCPEKR